MCKEVKKGIIEYRCNKVDGHDGCHECSWDEKDVKTGKTMHWSTWW